MKGLIVMKNADDMSSYVYQLCYVGNDSSEDIYDDVICFTREKAKKRKKQFLQDLTDRWTGDTIFFLQDIEIKKLKIIY